MSDTPKTDAACGWPWGHHGRIECGDLRWSPDGPFVHSEVARELERENAALRKELEAQAVVNGKGSEREAKLLAEVAALRHEIRQHEDQIEFLMGENTALNETAKKHVAAYYELLEKVRRLEQDLAITRQLRCHEIVKSEKEDV